MDGRIDNLNIHTLDDFVEAGKTLMRIVPDSGELIVEAFFDNRDIVFFRKRPTCLHKIFCFST
ncbi:HlyD family efflux transporter periplasmic adaptor subunit [Bartonella acomydis]|uniref:HlyD family efflux transporter periplasmic adaptor subunit n=1 Tax=Bartonella acomydis TaxID=686234 RepID=UPI0031EF20AB